MLQIWRGSDTASLLAALLASGLSMHSISKVKFCGGVAGPCGPGQDFSKASREPSLHGSTAVRGSSLTSVLLLSNKNSNILWLQRHKKKGNWMRLA